MNTRKILLAVGCCCLMLGCGKKTFEQYLESAEQHIAQHETNAAEIELKNAIIQNPSNGYARYLLGKIYLSTGAVELAEKELNKAIEYDYAQDAVMPLLSEALYLQNKDKELIALITEFESVGGEKTAEINLYLALGHFNLKDYDQSKDIFNLIIEDSNEVIYQNIGQAYHAIEAENIEQALVLLKANDNAMKNLPLVTKLQGQLLMILEKYEPAIEAFTAYYKARPDDFSIRLLLAKAYMKASQEDKALSHLNFLLANSPESALVNQMLGVIYYKKTDYRLAKIHLNKANRNGLDTPATKLMLGVVNFQLKSYEQAYSNLKEVIRFLPKNHPARKVFAMTQLELGENAEATETIQDIEYQGIQDNDFLLKAGFDLLESGMSEQAKSLINLIEVDKESPNAEHLASRGFLRLSLQDAQGILDLEQALDINPDSLKAKLTLGYGYLQTKDYDKVLKLADEIIAQYPNEPRAYSLAILATFEGGKFNQLTPYFKKLEQLSPNNMLLFIVKADEYERAGDYPNAVNAIEKIFTVNPFYIPAIIKYFKFNLQLGTPDVALKKIKQIAEQKPDDLRFQMLYAFSLAKANKKLDVISFLTKFNQIDSLPDFYWELLGDSYIAIGQTDKAIETYKRWGKNNPETPMAKTKLAFAYSTVGDHTAALETITDVIKQSSAPFLKAFQASLYLKTNQLDLALENVINLKIDRWEPNAVALLEGEIYIQQRSYTKSLKVLVPSYNDKPNNKAAKLITLAYFGLNNEKDNIAFLSNHVNNFPKDFNSRDRLAQLYIKDQPLEAMKHYEILLKDIPDNPEMLNNLAWLKLSNNEPKSALFYAKKAYDLSPDNKAIQDTYFKSVNANK